MGGRLRFNPHASDHRSGCHQLSIPAHTAKVTAGFGVREEAKDSRFEYRKMSLFHHIKERGYHLDDSLWNRVHDLVNTHEEDGASSPSKKRRSCSQHANSEDDVSSCSSQSRLHCLQKAIAKDFAGPFPIAKINFFEVYIACVRIVSTVSDNTHGGVERGRNCLCFLDAMLSAADRCKDNEHRSQLFRCRELVETCKDAMTAVLGGRGLDEFLWKGI